jgi:hypothetical protein
MGVFADIKLEWAETEHVIPSSKVMGLIFQIEKVLTYKELHEMAAGRGISFAQVAMAYGAALRYAGAKVEDDEVLAGMFQGEESQVSIVGAITGLLGMMVPPVAAKESAKAAPGNAPNRATRRAAAAPSSKKPSK